MPIFLCYLSVPHYTQYYYKIGQFIVVGCLQNKKKQTNKTNSIIEKGFAYYPIAKEGRLGFSSVYMYPYFLGTP